MYRKSVKSIPVQRCRTSWNLPEAHLCLTKASSSVRISGRSLVRHLKMTHLLGSFHLLKATKKSLPAPLTKVSLPDDTWHTGKGETRSLQCWVKSSRGGFIFRYLCPSLAPWPQLCLLPCPKVLSSPFFYPHTSSSFLLYEPLSAHGSCLEIYFWTPCLFIYLKLSKFIYQYPPYLIGGLRANWVLYSKGPRRNNICSYPEHVIAEEDSEAQEIHALTGPLHYIRWANQFSDSN